MKFAFSNGMLWLIAAVGFLGSLAGCGHAPEATVDPEVLATVGDRVITRDDFEQEIARRRASGRPLADAQAVVEELVNRAALLAQAQSSGLAEDPTVQREIGNLLIARLVDREVAPRLKALRVTPEEVRTAYEEELDRFTRPARDRLAILFLKVGPKASEARREEARQRLAEARRQILAAPAPGGRGAAAGGFGALAVDFSDDQTSRYRGGDIGWLEPGRFDYRWPRAVLQAGYALGVGDVSDLIETEAGLSLVMKTDARDREVTPFEKASAALRQGLLADRRRQLEETWRKEISAAAGVTLHESAIASLSIPPPATNVALQTGGSPGPGTGAPVPPRSNLPAAEPNRPL